MITQHWQKEIARKITRAAVAVGCPSPNKSRGQIAGETKPRNDNFQNRKTVLSNIQGIENLEELGCAAASVSCKSSASRPNTRSFTQPAQWDQFS